MTTTIPHGRHHAWLLVTYARGVNCAIVTPKLRTTSGVLTYYALAGAPDLLVEEIADTATELDDTVQRIRRIEGIESVSTHVVLETFEAARNVLSRVPQPP